ncbi:MAG: diacylglycerol kinase family lipid kinase [Chloroflexi bacterium]|nr:MAG: diacylglycerol kinase family lipid kinase [Chloroflexota bacterium]
MPQHKIIVNPTAGRGAGGRAIPHIERLLTGYGLDFDLVQTEHAWHASELAREAALAGYDVVVAVGGDGTSNEVLNGLMSAKTSIAGSSPREGGSHKRVEMGVLCTGRGNDFAYGVGIPTDLEAGCRTLAQGHRRTIDVGRVTGDLSPNNRYFGNGIGIGFDAVVGFESVKLTWLSGFPSYIVAVLKTVFLYYQAPLTQIEYDERTLTQPSLMISIMNGRRMGGGFYTAPQGQPDDGLLDLCIAHQVSRVRIFALIPHFLRGTQASQEPIRMERAQRVSVTAIAGTLPAHADGETLCTAAQQLEIELLPRQIEVICQPPEAV